MNFFKNKKTILYIILGLLTAAAIILIIFIAFWLTALIGHPGENDIDQSEAEELFESCIEELSNYINSDSKGYSAYLKLPNDSEYIIARTSSNIFFVGEKTGDALLYYYKDDIYDASDRLHLTGTEYPTDVKFNEIYSYVSAFIHTIINNDPDIIKSVKNPYNENTLYPWSFSYSKNLILKTENIPYAVSEDDYLAIYSGDPEHDYLPNTLRFIYSKTEKPDTRDYCTDIYFIIDPKLSIIPEYHIGWGYIPLLFSQ